MATPLKTWMIPKAENIIANDEITPADVSLETFEKWKEEMPNSGIIDDINAPLLAARCNELVDLAHVYTQVCYALCAAAKRIRKKEQALAIFERAPEYFASVDAKSTDTTKKAYVDIDKTSNKWKGTEDSWYVLYNYFSGLHDDFRDRHVWYRRIIEMKQNEMKTNPQQ